MTEQNLRTISVCWSGGMNGLGDALLHRREDDKACGNQPDTSLGTDLETAAVEDGNELCPACEWPDGCEAVLAGEYVHESEDRYRCGNCGETRWAGSVSRWTSCQDCGASDWEEVATDGGTGGAEAGRTPEDARIQKLEERNADLIGAIEEVRDLLKPFDLREVSEQAQDGDGQYEVVIHGRNGIEKEHAELIRKELLHDGYYEDVVSVCKIAGAGDGDDGAHTITCGHCGATNDLDAVKQQGCCHDCRGEIDV